MYTNSQNDHETSIIDVLNKIDEESNEQLNDNTASNDINEHVTANYSGFYMMINFIESNKSDIPESLRNNCMQNEFGFTLAMYWIRIMQDYIYKMIQGGKINETVPKWMRHNPEIRDNRGWTIAMHWVMIFKCDVPLWMRHDPRLQNSRGKTIGMIYLMNLLPDAKTSEVCLPTWMRHEINIFDEDGNGIIDYWLKFTNLTIPNWIKPDNIYSFTNKNGETCAMSWIIHRKTMPPDELKCDLNLKTTYGMTIMNIYKKVMTSVSKVEKSSNWIIHDEDEKDEDNLCLDESI